MSETLHLDLRTSVDDAVSRLVNVEYFHAGAIVSMPANYPSGTGVTLEVVVQPGGFSVSDRGGGYQEADFQGASRSYVRAAKEAASRFGLHFDGREFAAQNVTAQRLDGAMAMVSACSTQIAGEVASRMAKREERFAKQALFKKLGSIFGEEGFERDVTLIGASNHPWDVDAMIRGRNGNVVFNAVSPGYISVAGTAAKFHDLARLETAPKRVAVVNSKLDLGDWFGVIAGASDAVLEIASGNDLYLRMGIAA